MKGRDEQEKSTIVVTSMLHVFQPLIILYLFQGLRCLFLNPLLAVTFETLPKVFHNSSRVSIPLGENERADKIHKDCPIEVCGKTMCANLVELPMNDF